MRQRGAALLIAVALIFAVAVFGVIVTGSMSSSDVIDSASQGASIEAVYAAETGVERALKQFASGAAACSALAAGPITVVANRTFTTTDKGSTDFNGATPLPNSQCRIQVSGTVAGSNANRIIQAVLDRNLLAGANPGFNNPVGGAGQWTTTGRWDTTGGPDPIGSAPTACSRAHYAVKARNLAAGGLGSSTATINIAPAITVTTPTNITVRFNYRVIRVGNAANNLCNTDLAGTACPTGGANPPANDATICFSLNAGAFRTFATAMADPGAPINATQVTSPGCVPTTQQVPAAYATCATHYQQGTPTAKGQVLVPAPAASITQLRVKIFLRAAGNAREAWVDNIELINNSGVGIARVLWRDCSVLNCV